MLKAGEKFQVKCVCKRDSYSKPSQKFFMGKTLVVTDNQGLRQWKNNKTFYGEAIEPVSQELFYFHSIQIRRVKE